MKSYHIIQSTNNDWVSTEVERYLKLGGQLHFGPAAANHYDDPHYLQAVVHPDFDAPVPSEAAQ